ncbi:MAG: stage II sporulation protein P [Ruminococcus sp.]|nr:stage II sporulation protein P [Ruminococcus sp.]
MQKAAFLRAGALLCACTVTVWGVWLYSGAAEKMKPLTELAAKLSAGGYSQEPALRPAPSDKPTDIGYYWDRSHTNIAWDIPSDEPDTRQEETEPQSCEFPSPEPSAQSLAALPYSNGTNEDGPITEYFFTGYTEDIYFDLDNGGQVKNCTSLSNSDLYEESKKPYDFELEKTAAEPQILIYHTHTTEAFEQTEKTSYDSSFSCKTTDPDMSIVSVGDSICAELDRAGIGYVHDRTIHDHPSYNDAYDDSRESVQALLEQYPSIKIVLDVHRDGIQRDDGTRLAPVCEINGKKAAQIMLISGCDDGTMGMPNYIQNFHFACAFQSALETDWNGLTRPILFDYRHYNQDLTNGSLLIEIGSQANSIDQARYSGALVGKTLVSIFDT